MPGSARGCCTENVCRPLAPPLRHHPTPVSPDETWAETKNVPMFFVAPPGVRVIPGRLQPSEVPVSLPRAIPQGKPANLGPKASKGSGLARCTPAQQSFESLGPRPQIPAADIMVLSLLHHSTENL